MSDENKKNSFLKIPFNRILALAIMDVVSILVASFAALLIRFEFSFKAIVRVYFQCFAHAAVLFYLAAV